MLNFLGFRKDSKKCPPEKEVDGGFVIIGETVEEQRKKMHPGNVSQPSTNVVVQPSKPSRRAPALPSPPAAAPPAAAAAPALPDLLGDVPFTLAPQVLALQVALPFVPDVLLSRDRGCSLSSFQYDFTLENSVLHSA